jgi:hypothetical protein
VIIHPAFHWSPSGRRRAIKTQGLVLNKLVRCNTEPMAKICLALSPSYAWGLSAAVFGRRGEHWDCWQVVISNEDEVEILPFHGNRPGEIRILNHIPKDRVWLVGSRTVPQRGQRW